MIHIRCCFFVTVCLFIATFMGIPLGNAQEQEQTITFGIGPESTVPGPEGTPVITTRLVASQSAVKPGDTIRIAWDFKLLPHWHVYWQNPGDSGLPATLKLGGSSLPLTYPTPKVIPVPPITNYGYENGVILYASVPLSAHLAPGATNLPFTGSFLYCNEVCMPGTVSLTLPLYVASSRMENPRFPAEKQAPALLEGAQAHLNGNTIQLTLPATLPLPSGAMVRFFPNDEGTLNDSAPQPRANHTLTLDLDPEATTQPTTLQGLLVVEGTAYRVNTSLTKGTPAALNAGPGIPQSLGKGFFWAIGAAFLAGLILNLMPCVLPVLSLKVLNLLTHHTAHNRKAHMLTYTLGVMAAFWGFAFATAALRLSGATLGWGFHLQSPLFVGGLFVLMITLALVFFGVVSLGNSLTRFGMKPKMEESLLSSLGTGILAVIMATPCTVPFMGSAMAYALTHPLLPSLAVFSALGAGMAAPFWLAVPFPAVFRWLPKPGGWMSTLKAALGWPMLVTALWLLFVFANQTDTATTFSLLTLTLLLSFALWLKGNSPSLLRKGIVLLAFAGTAGGLVWSLHTPETTLTWASWSPEAVENARAQNVPVLVDFTADWCVTCKVNERTVLNTDAVHHLLAEYHTVLLKADWTKSNPDITAELERHGRKGVPLYLLYKPGQELPVILPQILTQGTIRHAFEM